MKNHAIVNDDNESIDYWKQRCKNLEKGICVKCLQSGFESKDSAAFNSESSLNAKAQLLEAMQ